MLSIPSSVSPFKSASLIALQINLQAAIISLGLNCGIFVEYPVPIPMPPFTSIIGITGI